MSHKKSKRQKRSKRCQELKKTKFRALITSALAIPALAASFPALAQQSPVENTKVKIFYADYEDKESGGNDRMRIKAPIGWLKSPLGNNFEIEGSFVLDSMSGASPFYHNVLTGASGQGVEDTRRAGDIKLTRYFENFAVGLGGIFSDEDDYESAGGLVDTRIWTEDKNTTLAFAASGNADDITSTLAPDFDDSRDSFNFLTGITQVLDPVSIMQVNLTFATGDGYFSDPYKTLDNRPRSRDQWAILGRYNRYIESLEGSLHADYRYYTDTWGINSHMIEFAWYQPVSSMFTLRPNIRYYSQSAADFFVDTFPPENLDGFISGDQRVSAFGGLTFGLKVIADLGEGFSADAQAGYIEQRPEWKLGSGGSSVIEPFYARYFTVGLSKQF